MSAVDSLSSSPRTIAGIQLFYKTFTSFCQLPLARDLFWNHADIVTLAFALSMLATYMVYSQRQRTRTIPGTRAAEGTNGFQVIAAAHPAVKTNRLGARTP